MRLLVTQTGSFTTNSKQPLDKQREIEQHVLTWEHFLQKSPLTKEVGEGRLPRVKSQESSFLRHVWNSRAVKASSKTSQKSGTKRWPPKTNTSLDLGAKKPAGSPLQSCWLAIHLTEVRGPKAGTQLYLAQRRPEEGSPQELPGEAPGARRRGSSKVNIGPSHCFWTLMVKNIPSF